MVYLPYTKGISTSELVEKIKSIKIMYYKTINVPIVLEVGEDIFVHLDDILKENHLYFKEKILVTSLELRICTNPDWINCLSRIYFLSKEVLTMRLWRL